LKAKFQSGSSHFAFRRWNQALSVEYHVARLQRITHERRGRRAIANDVLFRAYKRLLQAAPPYRVPGLGERVLRCLLQHGDQRGVVAQVESESEAWNQFIVC
jgi:hypothetical protein